MSSMNQAVAWYAPATAKLHKKALPPVAGSRAHVYFHVCVVDGVLEEVAGLVAANDEPAAPGVIFHSASGIDADAVGQAQTDLRRRILRAFAGWGLLESL